MFFEEGFRIPFHPYMSEKIQSLYRLLFWVHIARISFHCILKFQVRFNVRNAKVVALTLKISLTDNLKLGTRVGFAGTHFLYLYCIGLPFFPDYLRK